MRKQVFTLKSSTVECHRGIKGSKGSKKYAVVNTSNPLVTIFKKVAKEEMVEGDEIIDENDKTLLGLFSKFYMFESKSNFRDPIKSPDRPNHRKFNKVRSPKQLELNNRKTTRGRKVVHHTTLVHEELVVLKSRVQLFNEDGSPVRDENGNKVYKTTDIKVKDKTYRKGYRQLNLSAKAIESGKLKK